MKASYSRSRWSGRYLAFFLFGGAFPGHLIIPRLYILHVLLIPGLILALVTAHLFIMFHQKHTQMPGKGRTNENVVGAPMYPYFMAKTGAFFFFTFAVLALAATFAQINPIWLYGPFNPVAMSAGSQPDFYMGMLEGALRVMPAWQWVVFGHTFAFNVFIPALVPLGLVFALAAFWPFLEQWITGDRREHHINDRPRNAPARTAIGIAVITFYGVLWAEGANDIIADHLDISLYLTTWIARVAIFVGPVIAYIITKRICLALQRKDAHLIEHGVETGIIRQLPGGEFIEETRPVDEEALAVLAVTVRAPAAASPGGRRGRSHGAGDARRCRQDARAALQGGHREHPDAGAARRRPRQRPRDQGNGHAIETDGHNGHGQESLPAGSGGAEPGGSED